MGRQLIFHRERFWLRAIAMSDQCAQELNDTACKQLEEFQDPVKNRLEGRSNAYWVLYDPVEKERNDSSSNKWFDLHLVCSFAMLNDFPASGSPVHMAGYAHCVKIGIVTHEYPRATPYGGVAAHIRDLLPSLHKAGIEVGVFAPFHGTPTPEIAERLTLVPLHHDRPDAANPDHELAFRHWVSTYKPDLVHIHHLASLSMRIPQILQRESIPYVLHLHDVGMFCNQSHLLRNRFPVPELCTTEQSLTECAQCLVRSFKIAQESALVTATQRISDGRIAVEGATTVIYVSHALRTIVEEQLDWRPQDSHVMYPAMRWPLPAASQESLPKGSPTRLVMLGHATPIKGLDIAAQALTIINDRGLASSVHVDVYGTIPLIEGYHDAVVALCNALPNMSLHGPYDHKDISTILGSSDWLLCASRFEASPLVVHEAASLGVPSIGANIGGIPEKIASAGILFEATNPDDLAKAMIRATDASVRAQCSDQIGKLPDVDDQCAELIAIYQSIVSQPPPESSPVTMSVVISGHNHGATVLAAVQRLIDAGWNDDDELIIVDDCSTDDTTVKLGVLEGSVTLLTLPQQLGRASAMNEGALLARGEVLCLLDPVTATALPDNWRQQVIESMKVGPSVHRLDGLPSLIPGGFLAAKRPHFDGSGGLEPLGRTPAG